MQQDDDKSLYTTMRPARNGLSLVTFSTYEERQDVLRNTNIMEDDINHRSSRIYRNENGTPTNGTHYQAPPPPIEFSSSPPRMQQQPQSQQYANTTSNKFQQQQKPIDYYSNNNGVALKAPTEKPPEPPATPIPDYDNVEIATFPTTICSSVRPTYGYSSTNIVTTNARDMAYDNKNNNNNNQRTSRPGTITIGEYEQPQQRREPAKFDFVSSPTKRNNGITDVSPVDLQSELQNTLTRSKLKKSAETLEHQSNCPLRNSYENYENVVRKIHSVSINEVATVAPIRMSNGGTGNGGTNGILKNGNRHSSNNGCSTKNSDKTITFGN